MSHWLDKFVVVDFETTGLSPYYDRIIEFGYARFEYGQLVKRADCYVDPEGIQLSEKITEVTGIVPSDLHGAPPFWEVWNKAALDFYDAVPVAFNAGFDRAFLQYGIARAWPRRVFHTLPPCLDRKQQWVDVQPLVRAHLEPFLTGRSRKLSVIAEQLGISLKAHRADEDAVATGEILLHALTTLREDWSEDALRDRLKQHAYEREKSRFFWKDHQAAVGDERAWLPKGEPVVVYQCDVCQAMRVGHYTKKGWTMPPQWGTYGSLGELSCGPQCDIYAMWHDGKSGEDWRVHARVDEPG